ncbi:DUF4625 domain-containing protein [Bizionia sp. KMM 8389]
MTTRIFKSNFKFLAMVAFLGTFLYSCSSDDDASSAVNSGSNAPQITSFEYGEGSVHSTDPIAYKGGDIHIEAEILAQSPVSSITVIIHSHDLVAGEGEEEWDYENVYTDANLLVLNPTFHKHIPVPSTAPAGEYHLEFIVTDSQGNTTETEGHIDILEPISLSAIAIDGSVVRGNEFDAEFFIDAVNGVHSISVDIHAHDLPVLPGEVEWEYEDEILEPYHEQTAVEFHEHILVPATAPAGEYHVTFTVEDEDGFTVDYETHIDITVE